MRVTLAFEDVLQEHVLDKIFLACGFNFIVSIRRWKNGKGYLKKNARYFNNAAKEQPVILLTDLDTAACPPALILEWLGTDPHPDFVIRIACREVESWLIADRLALSSFLGISKDKLKSNPDEIPDPKSHIITLARKSRNRGIRNDITPLPHTDASIGIGYNSRLTRFVDEHWNPLDAAARSPSLSRAIRAIRNLHERLLKTTNDNAR
jgi:hypothetical protein